MSSPWAWSIFFALMIGGMNALSEGALKMTMETLSRVCDCDGVANSMTASTAAHDRLSRTEIMLVFLRRRAAAVVHRLEAGSVCSLSRRGPAGRGAHRVHCALI